MCRANANVEFLEKKVYRRGEEESEGIYLLLVVSKKI